MVKSACCSDGPAILNWLTVLMEPAERSNLEIPNHVDPREAYVAQIFSPGRFSTLAILKACNVSSFHSSLQSKTIYIITIHLHCAMGPG